MNFAIEVKEVKDGGFMATVDWSRGDAGKVGTSGAVKYANTEEEAYEKLYSLLLSKGHKVII